jgi:hypothetical protein
MQSNPMRRRWGLVALFLAAAPPVGATGAASESAHLLCLDAIRAAEVRYGTPPGLLTAIAKAESGRAIAPSGVVQPWPWAVNIGGVGGYFETKESAVAAIRRAQAINAGYTDVGCMQVNLQFHPKAFRSLDDAFDPVANVDYAARFLSDLRNAAAGNWFIAVGLYHSRSPDLAQLYRSRVTMAGTAIRSAGAGRLRIQLPNGHVMTINLNRQPSRARRYRSPCDVARILGHYMAPAARAQACATVRAQGSVRTSSR